MGDILSGVDGRVVQFLVGVELVGARESVSTHDHVEMEKRAKEENLGPNKKSKARNTHKCGIVKLFVI